jgi:hypothetical protein
MMFNILPFGNQTVVGNMTGAQIMSCSTRLYPWQAGASSRPVCYNSIYRVTSTVSYSAT